MKSQPKRRRKSVASCVKVGATLKEVSLLTRLTFILFRFLTSTAGASVTWVLMLLRLICFVCALLPAFLRLVAWYCRSPNIKKAIRYGPKARNFLDIYLPSPSVPSQHVITHSPAGTDHAASAKLRPVVVFVSGGAWIIGFRGWGGLMGRCFMQHGIVFVSPDYRNFPQGNVVDMLNDIDTAMSWIFANIASYGGDPNNVWLIGQSAGAHLGAMTVLRQIEREFLHNSARTQQQSLQNGDAKADGPAASSSSTVTLAEPAGTDNGHSVSVVSVGKGSMGALSRRASNAAPRWSCRQLRGYMGISGAFDLVWVMDHWQGRGLNRSLFTAVMGGREHVPRFSPTLCVRHTRLHLRNRKPACVSSELAHNASIVGSLSDGAISSALSNGYGKRRSQSWDEKELASAGKRQQQQPLQQQPQQPRTRQRSLEGLGAIKPIGAADCKCGQECTRAELVLRMDVDMDSAERQQREREEEGSVEDERNHSSHSQQEREHEHDRGQLFYALPQVRALFPPVSLYHGTADVSVPAASSTAFADALRGVGVEATVKLYAGKSHTDPILEDPMSGSDPLLEDLITRICGKPTHVTVRSLVSPCAVRVARYFNPF